MSRTAARFWQTARGTAARVMAYVRSARGMAAWAGSAWEVAAGLTAFVPAARALAAGASDVVEKFVRGRVTEMRPGGLLVETADGGQVLLQLYPATRIWNDTYVKSIPVEVGDQVTAWAARRRGRAYRAEQLWVNWIGLQGAAGGVRADGPGLAFEIRRPAEAALAVQIDSRTMVATRDARAAFADFAVRPAEGEWVQVIGRQLAGGAVLATEMFLPNR